MQETVLLRSAIRIWFHWQKNVNVLLFKFAFSLHILIFNRIHVDNVHVVLYTTVLCWFLSIWQRKAISSVSLKFDGVSLHWTCSVLSLSAVRLKALLSLNAFVSFHISFFFVSLFRLLSRTVQRGSITHLSEDWCNVYVLHHTFSKLTNDRWTL